ncbi:hypothetical protein [Peribacillus butanolivorans]|nr:hypothetical protein GM240_15980 [Peribacillus butanolivorans]
MSPRNYESAGKKTSKTTQGNKALKTIAVKLCTRNLKAK